MTLRQALVARAHAAADELAAYRCGYAARDIVWRVSARRGELHVRVHAASRLNLAVWIDDSPSMRAGRRRTLADAAAGARDRWCAAARVCDGVEIVRRLPDVFALPRDTMLLAVSDFLWLDGRCAGELAEIANAYDSTALIARDPWYEGLPLSGFVRVRDVETGTVKTLYLGAKERERYRIAVRRRERTVLDALRACGWQCGVFAEDDACAPLLALFRATE